MRTPVAGLYPVVPVTSALKPHEITSVVAVPVADVVTTVAHAPDVIADVPSADVPLATVVDTPPALPSVTPRAVATFVPKPETPVEIGRPVAFVNVADVGVPRTGVTNVGDVARANAPEPVVVSKVSVLTFELFVPNRTPVDDADGSRTS